MTTVEWPIEIKAIAAGAMRVEYDPQDTWAALVDDMPESYDELGVIIMPLDDIDKVIAALQQAKQAIEAIQKKGTVVKS